MSGWISVRNWRRFQHYDPDKRVPPWIKNNTDLMSNDDYLSLSGHQRSVLHGLWLEYASSRCQLRLNTSSLSSRLHLRVMSRDIEALSHAGFIDIVASKALAEGYQDASARAHATETEKEKETPKPPSGNINICPECGLVCRSPVGLAEHRERVHWVEPLRVVEGDAA